MSGPMRSRGFPSNSEQASMMMTQRQLRAGRHASQNRNGTRPAAPSFPAMAADSAISGGEKRTREAPSVARRLVELEPHGLRMGKARLILAHLVVPQALRAADAAIAQTRAVVGGITRQTILSGSSVDGFSCCAAGCAPVGPATEPSFQSGRGSIGAVVSACATSHHTIRPTAEIIAIANLRMSFPQSFVAKNSNPRARSFESSFRKFAGKLTEN